MPGRNANQSVQWILAVLALGIGALTNSAFADDTKITITVKKSGQEHPEKATPFTGDRAAVDVAILLDTSNSMDGLIGQAKSQLLSLIHI